MAPEQFAKLQPGDIIKHASPNDRGWMVTCNYGDRVTVVRTMDVTNPDEWIMASKVTMRTFGDDADS